VEQLEFRRNEVYQAFQSFFSLVAGDKGDLELIDGREHQWKNWKDQVKVDKDIILAGHSFGGATVVRPCSLASSAS
jgi:hypothetical protein